MDGLLIGVDRLGIFLSRMMCFTQIVIDVSIIRPDLDHLLELINRGLVRAPKRERLTESIVGIGVVGLEPGVHLQRGDRGAERRGRFSAQAMIDQDPAEADLYPRVIGPQPSELAKDADGLVGLAKLLEGV